MAQFKVQLVDGTTMDVIAHRVAADGPDTVFESSGNPPRALQRVPSNQVAELRQRVVDANGLVRWVAARPEGQSLDRRRS